MFARRKDKLKERRSYPQQDAVQVSCCAAAQAQHVEPFSQQPLRSSQWRCPCQKMAVQ
jgi:hypothetical protein